MSGFQVDDFRSSFSAGIAIPSKFRFKFMSAPPCLKGNQYAARIQELTMHIKKAQLPDQNIQTNPWALPGAGDPSKYPYENQAGDMNIEIISSGDFWERMFFTSWQNYIINYGISANNVDFLVGYYNDFIVNAEIEVYNIIGDIVYTVQLDGVWPVNLGIVDMDWSTKDTHLVFYVTLNYSHWSVKNMAMMATNDKTNSTTTIPGIIAPSAPLDSGSSIPNNNTPNITPPVSPSDSGSSIPNNNTPDVTPPVSPLDSGSSIPNNNTPDVYSNINTTVETGGGSITRTLNPDGTDTTTINPPVPSIENASSTNSGDTPTIVSPVRPDTSFFGSPIGSTMDPNTGLITPPSE